MYVAMLEGSGDWDRGVEGLFWNVSLRKVSRKLNTFTQAETWSRSVLGDVPILRI